MGQDECNMNLPGSSGDDSADGVIEECWYTVPSLQSNADRRETQFGKWRYKIDNETGEINDERESVPFHMIVALCSGVSESR